MSNRIPDNVKDTIIKLLKDKDDNDQTFETIAQTVRTLLDYPATKESVRSVNRRYITGTHGDDIILEEVVKNTDSFKLKKINKWAYNVPVNVDGNYMVIGDTHFPFVEPGYLPFLNGVYNQYNVTKVFHIGDIVDQYALSFFDKSPEADSAYSELLKSKEIAYEYYDMFDDVDVCAGNHDVRYLRQAVKSGLPEAFIKTLEEVLDMPDTWRINHSYIVNDETIVEHGTSTGVKATYDRAMITSMNVIQGHTHNYGGVIYINDGFKQRWGLNVGCGIDVSSYAAKYARNFKYKPTLGCGVVVDGIPMFIPFRG